MADARYEPSHPQHRELLLPCCEAGEHKPTASYVSSIEAHFFAVLQEELTKAVTEHPGEYAYGIDKVPEVMGRMIDAIRRGSFNKDGRAIKATCKRLDVKHTYKGIAMHILSGL